MSVPCLMLPEQSVNEVSSKVDSDSECISSILQESRLILLFLVTMATFSFH